MALPGMINSCTRLSRFYFSKIPDIYTNRIYLFDICITPVKIKEQNTTDYLEDGTSFLTTFIRIIKVVIEIIWAVLF